MEMVVRDFPLPAPGVLALPRYLGFLSVDFTGCDWSNYFLVSKGYQIFASPVHSSLSELFTFSRVLPPCISAPNLLTLVDLAFVPDTCRIRDRLTVGWQGYCSIHFFT